MPVTLTSVLFLISGSVSMLVFAFYRVQYLKAENITESVLNYLYYVDKCLEKPGVKIPFGKHHVTCPLYIIVAILFRLFNAYLFSSAAFLSAQTQGSKLNQVSIR